MHIWGVQDVYEGGRSFVNCVSENFTGETCAGAAKDQKGECRMDIIESEMAYLGYFDSESYGITWKVRKRRQTAVTPRGPSIHVVTNPLLSPAAFTQLPQPPTFVCVSLSPPLLVQFWSSNLFLGRAFLLHAAIVSSPFSWGSTRSSCLPLVFNAPTVGCRTTGPAGYRKCWQRAVQNTSWVS